MLNLQHPLRVGLLAACLLPGLISSAQAASSASSYLDFSGLSVTTYGTLSYSFQGFNPVADGYGYGSMHVNDTYASISASGTPISTSFDDGTAMASAALDTYALSSSAYAVNGGWSYSSADVYGSQLTLSGVGVIVFTLPYQMVVSASDFSDTAWAGVDMNLSSNEGDDYYYSYGRTYAQITQSIGVNDGNESSRASFLTLSFYYGGQSPAEFLIGASSTASVMSAPVPEPEAYAMFLAGLGLIGGIARRRSR